MNHAEIGARVAEKWNFPESLIAAIRFHHEPSLMTTDHKDVAFTVYLANAICSYEDAGIAYEQIDSTVLADFGLGGQKQFAKLVEHLSSGFMKESMRQKDSPVAKR
jgi:HD-like signal output (HDOD) protein